MCQFFFCYSFHSSPISTKCFDLLIPVWDFSSKPLFPLLSSKKYWKFDNTKSKTFHIHYHVIIPWTLPRWRKTVIPQRLPVDQRPPTKQWTNWSLIATWTNRKQPRWLDNFRRWPSRWSTPVSQGWSAIPDLSRGQLRAEPRKRSRLLYFALHSRFF